MIVSRSNGRTNNVKMLGPVNKREDYQRHIGWLPGEAIVPGSPGYRIRQLGVQDCAQAQFLFNRAGYHIPQNRVYSAAQLHGYQLRGIVRNHQYVVAATLSRHGPEYNSIQAFGALNDYMGRRSFVCEALPVLIRSLREELPELPSRMIVTRRLFSVLDPMLTEHGFYRVYGDDGDRRFIYFAPKLFDTNAQRSSAQGNPPGVQPEGYPTVRIADGGQSGFTR